MPSFQIMSCYLCDSKLYLHMLQTGLTHECSIKFHTEYEKWHIQNTSI